MSTHPNRDVLAQQAALDVVELHALEKIFELAEELRADVDSVVGVLEEVSALDPAIQQLLSLQFVELCSGDVRAEIQSLSRCNVELFIAGDLSQDELEEVQLGFAVQVLHLRHRRFSG